MLDTRSVKLFERCQWHYWDIKRHIKMRVDFLGGTEVAETVVVS